MVGVLHEPTFFTYDVLTCWLTVWSALALPTLQVVQPRLKKGAMIVADNIISSAAGYTDLVDYLSDKNNGFRTTTAPYDGGLLIAVYTG